MKTKHLFGIHLLFLCTFCFISCLDDNESKDNVKTAKMYISAETGYYKSGDITQDMPSQEGMKIKEEGSDSWLVKPFGLIEGFEYEKGYEYELLVRKTTLANPPADGSNISYKLIKILSQNKVK